MKLHTTLSILISLVIVGAENNLFTFALPAENENSEVELIGLKETELHKCLYQCQFLDIKYCQIIDNSLYVLIGLSLFGALYIILVYTPYNILKYFCRYNKPYEPKSIFKIGTPIV